MYVYDLLWMYLVLTTLTARGSVTPTYTSIHLSHNDRSSTEIHTGITVLEPSFSSMNSPHITFFSTSKFAGFVSISPTSTKDLTLHSQVTDTPVDLVKSSNTDSENVQSKLSYRENLSFSTDVDFNLSNETVIHTSMSTPVFFDTNLAEVEMSTDTIETQEVMSEISVEDSLSKYSLNVVTENSQLQTSGMSSVMVSFPSSLYDLAQDEISMELSRIIAYAENSEILSFGSTSSVSQGESLLEDAKGLTEMISDTVPLLTETHDVNGEFVQSVYDFTGYSNATYSKTLNSSDAFAGLQSSVTLNRLSDDIEVTHVTKTVMHVTNSFRPTITSSANKHASDGLNSATSIIYTVQEIDLQSSILSTNEEISNLVSQSTSLEVLSASFSQHGREFDSPTTLLDSFELTSPISQTISSFSVSEESVTFESSKDSLIASPSDSESPPSSSPYTTSVTHPPSMDETFSMTIIDSELDMLVTVIASDDLFTTSPLVSQVYTSEFLDSFIYTFESSDSGILTSVLTASDSSTPLLWEISLSTSMLVSKTDTPILARSQLLETVFSNTESFTSMFSNSNIFLSSESPVLTHKTVYGSELSSSLPSNRETIESMVLAMSSSSLVIEYTKSPETIISSAQKFSSKSPSGFSHDSQHISSSDSFSTEESSTYLSTNQIFSSTTQPTVHFIPSFTSTVHTTMLHGVSSTLDDYVSYSATATFSVTATAIHGHSITASTLSLFSLHVPDIFVNSSDNTKTLSSLTAASVTSIESPSHTADYDSSVFSSYFSSYENLTLSMPYHTSILSSSATPTAKELLPSNIIGEFSSTTSSSFATYLSTVASPVIPELNTFLSEYQTANNVNFTATSINGLSSFIQDMKTGTSSKHLIASFSVSSVIEHQQNFSTIMILSDFSYDKSHASTNTAFADHSVYAVDTTTVNTLSTSFSFIGQSKFGVMSSTSTKYSMNTVAISDKIESIESNELDSPVQTHITSEVFGTSDSPTMLYTSLYSDVISTVFSADLFSHTSLIDLTNDFPLSDSYLSNNIFPLSTGLSESNKLTKSTLFPGTNFDTPSSPYTESSVSQSLPEETRNILQDTTNLFTSFISLYTTNLTSYPISSSDLKSNVSFSTSFSYGSDHLLSSLVSLKPVSSDIISLTSLSTVNHVSKYITKQMSQNAMTSLSSKSMLSAIDTLISSIERISISELVSFTPILSQSIDSQYLITPDIYTSSLTENSSYPTHSSSLRYTSSVRTSDSQMQRTSHFITVSLSSFMDHKSIFPLTFSSSYSIPTTKALKVSTSVQSDSNLMSFMPSSRQITPSTTTSGIPNPTVEPTSTAANITDSRENFWVKTVLMARRSTNISGSTFRADIEARMAEAYNEAFKRERLIEQGLFETLRRKRYSYVGEAAVHLHDVTRVGDTTSVNVVYAVEKKRTILTADEAATSLNVLDAQELAIILRQVVQTVAEPYQSSSEPGNSENGGIPLWLIATIAGSVAGLIVLTWVSVCIYMKCFREKKEMEKHSEPTLTAIQHNDDMNDTRSRSTDNGRAGQSVKYDMSRQTSKTSFKKFTTYHVQHTDEEALIENASENKLDNSAYENTRTTPSSYTENQYTSDLKSQKRQSGGFGSNASLSNNQELEPPTTYKKASKLNSIEGGHIEAGHTNMVYSENFETKPKSHDHKYKVLQSSFSDQDNEELRERSRRERQANKARIKLKKRKHRPSVIDSTSGIPHGSIEMSSTRLPRVKVESGSPVKDATDNNKFAPTDRRLSTGDLSGDESLEEARSRMHKLLDDAFSLISPRASFAENHSRPYDHPFAVQGESTKMSRNKTFGMPETDLGSNIQEESMYVNPAYDSQSSFPLETWSPYRASDLVAMISMPSKQEQTRLGQKPKGSTRSLSTVPNRRPAANFDFSESKSASTLKDEKYTTSPAKPIVIRSKDLVDEIPTSGNRQSNARSNSGRTASDRTNSADTNIGRSNTGRTNSGRSQHGRTTVMVNPLPKENPSEQYDMTLLKNVRNGFPKKPKATEVDRIDSEQRDIAKRSEVDPNSDKFIQSLRDELSELKDMYVSRPNEHRNNKKRASSLRTDV